MHCIIKTPKTEGPRNESRSKKYKESEGVTMSNLNRCVALIALLAGTSVFADAGDTYRAQITRLESQENLGWNVVTGEVYVNFEKKQVTIKAKNNSCPPGKICAAVVGP